MKPKLVIAAAVVGVVVGYAIAAPYITVNRIGSALKKNDADALSQYVDFPAVRQSLKDGLKAAMTEKAVRSVIEANPFASLGAMLAGAIADKIIDAMVTPAGLRRLLSEGNLESAMSVVNRSNEDSDYSLPETSMAYESLDSFAVVVGDEDDGDNLKLILKRNGFSWKLSEIRL